MKDKKDNQNGYINKYLVDAFKGLKISQTQIIKDLGDKPQSYVSALMNGKKKVGKEVAKQLSILYGFDIGKILAGDLQEEPVVEKDKKTENKDFELLSLKKEIERLKKTNEEIIANQKGTLLFLNTMMDKIFTKFDIDISSAEQKEIKEVIKKANLN